MKSRLSNDEFFVEMGESIKNIDDFLGEIIKNKLTARIKPMSVELRKLLNPGGQGNFALQRAQERFGVKFNFPDRSKTLPRTGIQVSLDEYIKKKNFFIVGGPLPKKK